MRDRLLGRSLCCASISATVFFEKALDFLLVGFFIETYAFSCSVILPGQLIRKWLQERSILQPLYFCLCFPALKITPTELFQISETDFSPGCNFQVTWSTKKSYFSIVIASDPAWLTSPFPLSHQTTPCIEGMKGFSASFPAVCTQKGTPLRLILKRSALKVFGTGTYALLYTVICYDVPSFDFLLHKYCKSGVTEKISMDLL